MLVPLLLASVVFLVALLLALAIMLRGQWEHMHEPKRGPDER
jgi:hypothetical protein